MENKMEDKMEDKITVVMLEVGKEAKVMEIDPSLASLQKYVGGGYIEAVYPFRDDACIICNDEGKFNGMRPNRTLYGEGKQILDIIYGPFFICGKEGENFSSLTPELQEKYSKLFYAPEKMMFLGGKAMMVPFSGEKKMEEVQR